MIKEEKRITGHITKRLHPVKVQSYADDSTIIINLPRELKYIMEIYDKHSAAPEAAINEEKTQIFPLGKHIIKQLEHDKFTKKVKNKVTILGAIFCQNKEEETKENLKKANKTLDTMAQVYSKYASLAGKILHLNTFVLSTIIWNNAWLIDIKDEHYKKFVQKIENYLHWYKGKEIMEHVSKDKNKGGMGLINPTERIRCIKLMEYLNAKTQMPEIDNLVYEVGTMQRLLYGTDFKRAKSAERNPELLLLIWNLNKITNFKASHKDFKPKDLQNIIFPKAKITYFLEIYEAEEPKLISINYLMLHGLLSFRGNKLCYLCKQYEENLDHLLFHCPFLTQSPELVKGWLRLMGCQAFNRQTIIEMTGIQSGIENFAISTYKDVIWKNRNIVKLRPVLKNTIYNVLERTVSFYIRFIFKP